MLELRVLAGEYAIWRLPPASSPPAPLLRGTRGVVSITWTAEELSIVCLRGLAPKGRMSTSRGGVFRSGVRWTWR